MHIQVVFLLAGAWLSFAAHAEISAERMTLQGDNVQIEGVRYKNSEGQYNTGEWIYFPHGLDSNYHAFRYVIPILVEAGYDCYAFNFRGHGNGDERSKVLDYREGDYEMEQMAKIDLPLIIKKIQELNPNKGHIVGHSMGGMVPRAAIKLGTLDQSILKSIVLLGSPPHFRSQGLIESLIAPLLQNSLFRGAGNEDVGMSGMSAALESMVDTLNILNPLYFLIKDSMTRIKQWQRDAMSRVVPKDILRSFARFKSNYPYEDVTLDVPALYIMGDQDILVRSTDIVETAKVQSKDAGYWLMRLKGVGHLSLVAPPAIAQYAQELLRFLKNPHDIGQKNETTINYSRVPLCQALLVAF